MLKLIAWLVAIIVVVGGVWYFWSRGSASPVSTGTSSSQTQGTSQNADTSDAALQQDSASIDTQLQGASADSDSAASFSDTPVQQTE
jgi:hypothetical protein